MSLDRGKFFLYISSGLAVLFLTGMVSTHDYFSDGDVVALITYGVLFALAVAGLICWFSGPTEISWKVVLLPGTLVGLVLAAEIALGLSALRDVVESANPSAGAAKSWASFVGGLACVVTAAVCLRLGVFWPNTALLLNIVTYLGLMADVSLGFAALVSYGDPFTEVLVVLGLASSLRCDHCSPPYVSSIPSADG